MARNNNRNNVIGSGTWSKLKWLQSILFAAATAVIIALIIFSGVSYVQTEIAFKNFNDPTLTIFGITVGNYISHLFAVIFQYGQNVALAYKQ